MGAASQELTERAKLLISERRYQEAVRACRRALLSQPDELEIRLLLGEALLALERYDEVRVEMMALARKVPNRAEVHRLLGEAYLRDGRPQQAAESLKRALELDPKDEVLRELLLEASDHQAPSSTTIERWFADEAVPTVETDSPAWEEEKTSTGALPPRLKLPPVAEPSSVEIAPELKRPPSVKPPPPKKMVAPNQTRPGTPRVRSRKPTALGQGMEPPPPKPAPMPQPVPQPRPVYPGESTQAHRPSALRAPAAEPNTDELDIVSLGDAEPVGFDARLDQPIEPDDFAPYAGTIEPITDHPTRARPMSYAEMEEEPSTETRGQALRGVPPSPFFEPPTPVVPAAPVEQPRVDPAVSTERVRRGGKKSLLLPIALGGAVLFLVVFIGAIGIAVWQSSTATDEIHAAAERAGDTGLKSDIEAALALIGDDDDPELLALRARLLATLVHEHGADREGEVRTLLMQLEGEELTDAQIATALIHLHGGDPQRALSVLAGVTAEREQIQEGLRAYVLAKAALGDYVAAEAKARDAAVLRPNAPRHAALYALMRHRVDDSQGALRHIDALADGVRYPAIRIARARILKETGGDDARALEEATAVVRDLSARASVSELAWAHLLMAHYAAAQGSAATALSEARTAGRTPPSADEPFGILLVETLLRAGAPREAEQQLGRLPSAPVDRNGRALLEAEVALAVADLPRAERALATASDGLLKDLLSAQLFEARGRPQDAEPLYERVQQQPGPEGRRASVRLAAIAMRAGNARRAVELLERRRPTAVDDGELVSILVRAYLALGQLDEAQRAVDAALAVRRAAPELLAARGAIELRRGQVTQALASLREAVEARPGDADMQADLGEAARRAGELETARTAYDAALAVRADQPRALLGLARLAIAAGDLAQAEEKLNAAARSNLEPTEVARVRGEILVLRGDGAAGVQVLDPIARTVNDADVWVSLGHLLAQAEEDRDAVTAYRRALSADRNSPEALLGQSLVEVRQGQLGSARRSVGTAEEEGRRRALGPAFAARLAVARARLAFENGDFDGVVTLANQAIASDARIASAHLLLANVAGEREESPVEHLRRAVAGQAPPPEAIGQLVPRLAPGEEACTLARRYLQVAPEGYDASDVRDVADRCR